MHHSPSAISPVPSKIIQDTTTDPELRDSAQLGLASALEANGKIDDAINTYLAVAQQGDKSPFAPYAYTAAARIYEGRGDKENERKILTAAASLDPDSKFVKQAQQQLKEMGPATQPSPSVPASATPAVPK
jgi:tetratricopeptide (TPR) repeat protein